MTKFIECQGVLINMEHVQIIKKSDNISIPEMYAEGDNPDDFERRYYIDFQIANSETVSAAFDAEEARDQVYDEFIKSLT